MGKISMLFERIKRRMFNRYYNSNMDCILSLSDVEIMRIQQLRLNVKDVDLNQISTSTEEWIQNLHELKQCILTNDPRYFLKWDVIKKTMFFEPPEIEYKAVVNAYTEEQMCEDIIGNPKPYYACLKSSGNLIHNAYSLQQILNRLNLDDIDAIVEFGGGYGSMCRLARKLGFTKDYHIFDLPLFLSLQKYFLQSCAGEYSINTHFINDLSDLDVSLELIDRKKILCIGTWSVSEAPVELRDAFLHIVGKANYLIAYQEAFSGVNNMEYFQSFQNNLAEIDWDNQVINHLPGHHYLIGVVND